MHRSDVKEAQMRRSSLGVSNEPGQRHEPAFTHTGEQHLQPGEFLVVIVATVELYV